MRMWRATLDDKPALTRAYAAYLTELLPTRDPHEPDPYFDLYWSEPDSRFAYLFGDGEPQGFAFVRIPKEPDIDFELAEFCIAPNHRRKGRGTAILPHLFARHPGRWDLGILLSNAAGLAFWPQALKAAQVRDVQKFESDGAISYEFSVP